MAVMLLSDCTVDFFVIDIIVIDVEVKMFRRPISIRSQSVCRHAWKADEPHLLGSLTFNDFAPFSRECWRAIQTSKGTH